MEAGAVHRGLSARATAHLVACLCPLQQIIEDPLMRHSAILVFANKQDLVRWKAGCASGDGGACRRRPLQARRAVSCCAPGRRFIPTCTAIFAISGKHTRSHSPRPTQSRSLAR